MITSKKRIGTGAQIDKTFAHLASALSEHGGNSGGESGDGGGKSLGNLGLGAGGLGRHGHGCTQKSREME